nr:hypothetical protein HmN_000029100 [Hymenolepis microstoma]
MVANALAPQSEYTPPSTFFLISHNSTLSSSPVPGISDFADFPCLEGAGLFSNSLCHWNCRIEGYEELSSSLVLMSQFSMHEEPSQPFLSYATPSRHPLINPEIFICCPCLGDFAGTSNARLRVEDWRECCATQQNASLPQN